MDLEDSVLCLDRRWKERLRFNPFAVQGRIKPKESIRPAALTEQPFAIYANERRYLLHRQLVLIAVADSVHAVASRSRNSEDLRAQRRARISGSG